jgi:hypothetical protein
MSHYTEVKMNVAIDWKVVVRLLVGLSLLIPLARQAQALPPRPPPAVQVFVSVSGSDQNNCLWGFPCRNVEAALNVVGNGGEVWILDSGDFNQVPVIVGKSVTIQAVPGALANLWASAGSAAIQINVPGGTVTLRNLTIGNLGTNPGPDGVDVTAAGEVSVETCVFNNTVQNALYVAPGSAVVHVSNTTFRNVGAWAVSADTGTTVDISGSRILHTGGVSAYASSMLTAITTTVSVTDTTISDGPIGVSAFAQGLAATAQAFVTRSAIFSTTNGLQSQELSSGTPLITVSNSSVTHNQNAFYIQGGTIKSLGNNYIADNASEQGTLTPIPLR